MPDSAPPIQFEPEIPENLRGRWNYLQSEHLLDKVYPENPATINFERAYIRRIAKAESQLARYRAPVSDEEQEHFMQSARDTIAKEYGRSWDQLLRDVSEFEMTATDVLMDLARTEAKRQVLAERGKEK